LIPLIPLIPFVELRARSEDQMDEGPKPKLEPLMVSGVGQPAAWSGLNGSPTRGAPLPEF
jgi:hypothetical protein